jgi:hypothetical protein
MHTKAQSESAEVVAVKKQDLIDAWRILENLTISLHKIGGAYAVPTRDQFTPEVERRMLEEIGRFTLERIVDDANRFRIALGDYLPDEEAEALADQIDYWRQTQD